MRVLVDVAGTLATSQTRVRSSKRWLRACGNPVRHGTDHELLPLLALRVQVLRIVMHRETVLRTFDLHQHVLDREPLHGVA
jgi:hypothetical protein